MQDVIKTTLSAAVPLNGTFTVAYPAGKGSGSYSGGYAHKMAVSQSIFYAPVGMTVAFGASNITVTYKGATTIPAGAKVTLGLDILGEDSAPANVNGVTKLKYRSVDLGAPITADADGISASQSVGAAAFALINGALASGAIAVFDRPRNVVGAWTTNSVVTVTGTDEYGKVVVEACASGATFTGKKAFKTITSILSSASITSATFGTGDVLGLPIFLPGTGYVMKELQDGAAPTAGTVVAGVQVPGTSTSGDVRGTYDPNAACDGSKAFRLLVAVEDDTYKGLPQFAG